MKPLSLKLRAAGALLICGSLLPIAGFADEGAIVLKDAPGRNKVLDNCSMCHSVDYVQMNSPFMNKEKWEATVSKMINVMGAPIAQDDVPTIVDYLVNNYGVK